MATIVLQDGRIDKSGAVYNGIGKAGRGHNVKQFEQRLRLLGEAANRPLLLGALRGLEVERLRVDGRARLATAAHPQDLGSALCHPFVTTDYSEALLEFITAPCHNIADALANMQDNMAFGVRHLPGELLWPGSAPCILGAESEIPVAMYGNSHLGRLKTLYRIGLGHRYGRQMQTVAGIHFNWSLPDAIWSLLLAADDSQMLLQDYRSAGYFAMIRNFCRRFWLLLYAMGASPACARSFVAGREHSLAPLPGDDDCLHGPHATSLRMSSLGYQSSAQASLRICYNKPHNYINTLLDAICQVHPPYSDIGLRDEHGQWLQLHDSLLQIENEFYSTVRPKQTARPGETGMRALAARGVEYVEVRCLDLNPWQTTGISPAQLCFVEAFLVACMLADSPQISDGEYDAIAHNQNQVAARGRAPGLQLARMEQGERCERPLQDWGLEILAEVALAAELLDNAASTDQYSASLAPVRDALDDPGQSLSGRLLADLQHQGFIAWHLERARQLTDELRAHPLSAATEGQMRRRAAQSLAQQRRQEEQDSGTFDDFLARYLAQYHFRVRADGTLQEGRTDPG